MKRTVLLSLGFAAALVANAGIKDAVMMELPQSANRQAVEFKEKKVVAAPTVYNQKVVSAGKLVKSFKNMGIYQTKDGKYVRVINKNNKLDLNNYSKSKAVEAAADASFSENFDGWDGETANWLPTGWSQESKVGSDANLMWGVAEGNFYAMAYEGYSLNITAAMDLDPETFAYIFPEQDEWCYSPAFTVAAGDYLSFMLNYDPGLTLLNWDVMQSTSEYVFDKENTNLEVKISTDNGANWTTIWDAVSDAKTMSDDELYSVVGTSPWKGVVCDLSAYAGQSVKLAFRFVGSAGNDMMIDNLSVGEVTPVASYSVPVNLFVNSTGLNSSYYPFARLAPAYADIEFTNESQLAESYEWMYNSSEDGSEIFSDDNNLTVNYPYSQWRYPTLTATTGSNSSEPYQFGSWINSQGAPASSFWQTGGYIAAGKDDVMDYPVVNWEKHYHSRNVYFGADLAVNCSDEAATSLLGKEGVEATFDSYATLIQAPSAPYAFYGVYLTIPAVSVTGDENQTVTVSVYSLTAEGTRGDLIGSGECKLSDNISSSESTLYVPCYFTQKIGALTQQVPLTIDEPVLVCITAGKGLVFNLINELSAQTGLSATGWADGLLYESNYMIVKDKETGDFYYIRLSSFGLNPEATETPNWELITGIGVEFDVIYNWLYENTGNYTYEAPATGGDSEAFVMNSLLSSEYWTVEGDGLFDWVDYTIGDFDTSTGDTELTFSVQPLPEGVSGRKTAITISTYGAAPVTFGIFQGDAGVSVVETSANRVNVVNGNFEVEAATATAVDVYNVAGQKVASAAIEGTTVVPAQDLAKGMYILKFNDNTAVKVMK